MIKAVICGPKGRSGRLGGELFGVVAGMAEPPLRLSVEADAIDGIRAALESRLAELEKSAQRGRLAQQH